MGRAHTSSTPAIAVAANATEMGIMFDKGDGIIQHRNIGSIGRLPRVRHCP
jgi:hypothetical protein